MHELASHQAKTLQASLATITGFIESSSNPNHVAIFVETHEAGPGSGFLYHVEGNILQEMTYSPKRAYRLEDSALFVPGTKVLIGRVAVTNYPQVNLGGG